MAHSFTRLELYNLVWSEPMRDISARFGLSDVGLAKACRNASIPVPPRGYWNKHKAGHRVARFSLPPREPGYSDTVVIGKDRYWRYHVEPINENEPEPPEPTFDESIESVRARVEKRTRAVRSASSFDLAHPQIKALLDKDERRREKQRASSYAWAWDAPVFDTPLQKRRLRILNAILLALAQQGYGGFVGGDKGEDITLRLGHLSLELELAELSEKPTKSKDAPPSKGERLRLRTKPGHKTEGKIIAEDIPGQAIESRLRAVVVDLIVLGEERYRDHLLQSHKWTLQRRAERIEEARKQKIEAERQERERLAALEQARLDRLLGEAADLQTARNIRAYVEDVRAASTAMTAAISEGELAAWSQWALTQADRIDPVASRRFLNNEDLKLGSSEPST